VLRGISAKEAIFLVTRTGVAYYLILAIPFTNLVI